MPERQVLQATVDGVTTLTLNRPAALNSFTALMHGQLMAALDEAAADRDVRCLVLTGSGRGFCTGQDLADLIGPEGAAGGEGPDLGALLQRHYHPLLARLRSMPVPVVAAINGVAAGAGASLALACDIAVASDNASFLLPFTQIGLVPDTGASWLLPRLVGRARAFGLAMLADKLGAREAQSLGLVWRAVEPAAFEATVGDVAGRLARTSTAALVATRALMDAGADCRWADYLPLEEAAMRERGRSPDCAEGLAAFVAKRAPRFTER